MQITVQQIAGGDFQAADFHRPAKFNNVYIRMRDGHVAGEQLKAQRLGRRNVAHRTVRHRRHTIQRFKDIDMHPAQQGAKANPRGVIFHHHHAWRRE